MYPNSDFDPPVYYSSYGLVQVSPKRWMVVRLSGTGRCGNPLPTFSTLSFRSETPAVSRHEAETALTQLQNDEAKGRVECEAQRAVYESRGRSPFDRNPGRTHRCPVCLDREVK
jgi:hypothetical protein